MKKLLLSTVISGIAIVAITAHAKSNDPVVMTIDNRDVKLSEFEYLYNKNNNQQLTPLTFDEYVDMFVNYKLKVADALNAKLDTASAFKTEYDKFRRELAQPYLRDSVVAEALVNEVYSHLANDVFVSHIMLPIQDPTAEHVLDSLRQMINNGELTFEEVAMAHSVDKASGANGGRMAWVTGLSPYPWEFEKAAYDTPVGQISEVINSGAGYHLVRPEEIRPARGEVNVQHILVLTQGMSEEEKNVQKAKIDSIYQVVTTPGVDFSEVAKRESQDPGSARNGGDLGWFGSGRMVAEFDSISFALADGAISEPFATSYGYHIVHKLGHRGVRPLEDVRPAIEKAIESDFRAFIPIKATRDRAAEQTHSVIYDSYIDAVKEVLDKGHGMCDTTIVNLVKEIDVPAYVVNGKTVNLKEIMAQLPLRPNIPTSTALDFIQRGVKSAFDNEVTLWQVDQLERTEPAYANLINEYRDGILLFDISNQKVWERASKDRQGLEAYFAAHKDKYCDWTAPRFKAYVLFAETDSALNVLKEYVEAVYGGQKITEIDREAFTNDIKSKFGKSVRVERVIAAKGENPITDYLGFGGPKPEARNRGWNSYAAFAAELIDQPVEVNDVKGAVVTDYQVALEKEWIEQLHKKYKVKINKKELEKANK